MSYDSSKLRASPSQISDGGVITAPFQVTNTGAGHFWLSVYVTAVSGGGPTYATGIIEGEFNEGVWETVANVEVEDVTGIGTFKFYATSLTGLVPPRCRLVLTASAGQSITVSEIRQGVFTDDGNPGRVSSPTGGSTTVTINSPTGPNLAADSVSITWATDDRGEKTMANSISTTLATDDRKAARQLDAGDTYREDHSVLNITTAWRTIFTTTTEILWLDIFDSSGEDYQLGWGGDVKALVAPGGYTSEIKIPSGTDVQIKTASGTISGGVMVLNSGKA